MPFVPATFRFAVKTELLKVQPWLKLLDTTSVLTFHFPKFDSQGPHDKPNSKLELAAKGCESTPAPKVRTFNGLMQVTDKYWDVKWLGPIDSDDVLIALTLQAGKLMDDLAPNGSLKNPAPNDKSDARRLYEAIAMRRRLQLQFAFGDHVKSGVLVDFDH
jgi:hypothetical protein